MNEDLNKLLKLIDSVKATAEYNEVELLDVFTDYGLMGVYTLWQKNMYEYLKGDSNE